MKASTHAIEPEAADPAAWFVHRGVSLPERAPGHLSDVLHLLGAVADDWAQSCVVPHWRSRRGSTFCRESSLTQAI